MLDLANHDASCAPLEAQLRAHLRDVWQVERHVLGKDEADLAESRSRRHWPCRPIVVTASEMSHAPRAILVANEGVSALVQSLTARASMRVASRWSGWATLMP